MFNINGETWYLMGVPANHPMLQRKDGSYSIAACDDESKTIYILRTLRGPMLQKVLAHEITHAAMFSYNVSLTESQEELLADLLATYGNEIIAITNKVFKKLKERPWYY